jgi:two-component system OmpR family response regulator
MHMRVLLLEDDIALSAALSDFLMRRAFVVETASTLHSARLMLPLAQWGVVLLDLHLPDGDGLSLLPAIRRQAPQASILILTARDQISDRIGGLDAGADDYLVKPFDPEELLARLRAVERRRTGSHSAVVTIGALVIDLSRNYVRVQDQPVDLTSKEWALLRVMAMRPDRIHSRVTLNDALYGFDSEAASNTLDVFVSNLRRKLGRNSIQTLRGLGYRLTGESA